MSGSVTQPQKNINNSPAAANESSFGTLVAEFSQETLALTRRLFLQLQRSNR